MAKDHMYKGYLLVRGGTREYPWNIYRMDYSEFLKKEVPTHVGYAQTLKGCKIEIDEDLCSEEQFRRL